MSESLSESLSNPANPATPPSAEFKFVFCKHTYANADRIAADRAKCLAHFFAELGQPDHGDISILRPDGQLLDILTRDQD